MRYLYLLLTLILVSSCAHNRLRLRKVQKHDTTAIAQNEIPKDHPHKKHAQQQIIVVETEHTNNSVTSPETTEAKETKAAHSQAHIWMGKDEKDPTSQYQSATIDSTEEEIEDDPSDAVKVSEAIRAEQLARRAKNSFIASFVLMFLPIASLFSFPFFILGSILLALSNRSNYITQQGERFARKARIMQIVYLALLVLGIAIMLAFIFI